MARASYAPKGWPTIVPRIFAYDAKGLVKFVKKLFDAAGDYEAERPTVLTIGDSKIMITEAGIRDAAHAVLYVYVPDADATYKRAVAARAKIIEKPMDLPYGDRRCMIEDKWGNAWQIATPLKAIPRLRKKSN